MNYKINVGDAIPQFQAKDQNGKIWSNKDFAGKIWVLYFYPKDDTPGCIQEACSFRDSLPDLSRSGVEILGVSPDNAESHKKFIQKHGLNFNLITDEENSLCKAFDVLQEKNTFGNKSIGVIRTTFLIDETGHIKWIERPVSVVDHVERLKEAMEIR